MRTNDDLLMRASLRAHYAERHLPGGIREHGADWETCLHEVCQFDRQALGIDHTERHADCRHPNCQNKGANRG